MAPQFGRFVPQGIQSNNTEKVEISYEEYEALKLCDYELLTQAESAEIMNISRPTFTRIYESVRRKIAKAFVEGSCICFEGGDALVASWYKCQSCSISFTINEGEPSICPICRVNMNTLNAGEL